MICSVFVALPLEILERFHAPILERAPGLSLGGALDEALPDGGLPRGVVEVRAPRVLAGATTIAIAAVRASQRNDARAWAAWIDPEATLHAPGLAQRGVVLERLVVVRPERRDLVRVATKVASSGAFDVIVVDVDPIACTAASPPRSRADALFVRRLALGAERSGGTVLLLSDARVRREPWPVALRLELERGARERLDDDAIIVRVGKERHGRVGRPPARVALSGGV